MRAPRSLREALEEAAAGRGGFPHVRSSKSSFFERARDMRWEFFAEVFEGFTASVLPQAEPDFEADLRGQSPAFAEVWVVDGSGLDPVARRLGVVRDVERVVIPGSVLAFYDLYRGIVRKLVFRQTIVAREVRTLRECVAAVPAGTLLIADRGFSSTCLLRELVARGIDCVVRLKTNVVVHEVVATSASVVDEGVTVTDRTVVLGRRRRSGTVRLVEKPLPDGTVLRLVTTVLDPTRLPTSAVLAAYRRRWPVERLFSDVKTVLNLRRFYAANTNAVGMQLFATAIVHTAMRITQARIAREHSIRPETLSSAKLYARLAAAHFRLTCSLEAFEAICAANPGVPLVEPRWGELGLFRVPLSQLLADPRTPNRPRRRFSEQRRYYVALQKYERRRLPRGASP